MANHRKYFQEAGDDHRSPPANDAPPLEEPLGGYIFVCNNDTMGEDLKRSLFGLPQRYHDSVRAIQPGMPLFLYNYSMHRLHGIFEASSEGGLNLDPVAWENKDYKNGRPASRFPSQVRVRLREERPPLPEKAFRPVLHHYDGPKFRLELSQEQVHRLLVLFGGSTERDSQTSSEADASVHDENDDGEWEKVKGRSKGNRNHSMNNHRSTWSRRASSPGKTRYGSAQMNGFPGSGHAGHGSSYGSEYSSNTRSTRDSEDRHRGEGADAPRWRVDAEGSTSSQSAGNSSYSRGDDHRDHYQEHHDGWGGGRRVSRSHREGGSGNGAVGSRAQHGHSANGGHSASSHAGSRDGKEGPAAQSNNSGSNSNSSNQTQQGEKGSVRIDAASDVRTGTGTAATAKPSSGVIDNRAKPVSFAAVLRGGDQADAEQSMRTEDSSVLAAVPVNGNSSSGRGPSAGNTVGGATSASSSLSTPANAKPRVLPAANNNVRSHNASANNRRGVKDRTDADRLVSAAKQSQDTMQHAGKVDKKGEKPLENGIAGEAGYANVAEKPFAWSNRKDALLSQTKVSQICDDTSQASAAEHGPAASVPSPAIHSNAAGSKYPIPQAMGDAAKSGEGSTTNAQVQVRPNSANGVELLSRPAEAEIVAKPVVRRPAWQGNDGMLLRRLANQDHDSLSSSKGWETQNAPLSDSPTAAQPQQKKQVAAGQVAPAGSKGPYSEATQGHQHPPSIHSKAHFPSPPSQVQTSAAEYHPQSHPSGDAPKAVPSQSEIRSSSHPETAEPDHAKSPATTPREVNRHTYSTSHATLPRVHTRPSPRHYGNDGHHDKGPQRKHTPPPRQDMQTPPPILQPPPQLHPLPPSAASAPPFRVSTPPLTITSPIIHQYSPVYSHSQPASPLGRATRVRQGDPVSPLYRITPRPLSEAAPSAQSGGLFAPLVGLQPILSPIVGHPHFPMPASALLSNVTALHNEVMEYSELVRPPKEARARAECAVSCVRAIVKSLWPGADVEVFGSFATGLALPNSDVDVAVVNAPPPPDTPETQSLTGARISAPLIRDLAAVIQKQEWCESMYTIETARIPVIKLKCQPKLHWFSSRSSSGQLSGDQGSDSGSDGTESQGSLLRLGDPFSGENSKNLALAPVAMDITIAGCRPSALDGSEGTSKEWMAKLEEAVNAHNGEAAREFVKEKMHSLPALAPLALLLKSWLQHRGLNDVYTGGLGSFSLTLMLVFYLERAPVPVGTPTPFKARFSTHSQPPPAVGDEGSVGVTPPGESIPFQQTTSEEERGESSIDTASKEGALIAGQVPENKPSANQSVKSMSAGAFPRESMENERPNIIDVPSSEGGISNAEPSEFSEVSPELEKTVDELESIENNAPAEPSEKIEAAMAETSNEPTSGACCSISSVREGSTDSLCAYKSLAPPLNGLEMEERSLGKVDEVEGEGGEAREAGECESPAEQNREVAESVNVKEECGKTDTGEKRQEAEILLETAKGEKFSDEDSEKEKEACSEAKEGEGLRVAEAGERKQESDRAGEGSASGPFSSDRNVTQSSCSEHALQEVSERVVGSEENGEASAASNSDSNSGGSSPTRVRLRQALAAMAASREGVEGKGIVEELPDSIKSVPSPSFGILLVGFLQAFGHEIEFSRVRLVLKNSSSLPDGVFWHDPTQRPTALWIDDPLRPGANIGAGSFAIWHVQAAFRDLLISVTRPQQVPSSSPPTEGEGRRKPWLYLLEQAFNAKFMLPGSPGRT